ncbi:MAG: hypothetical protein KY469_16370 [Actinobacteria bacterium]|nr:hypothetical protein [Actinomycetota bacterium]
MRCAATLLVLVALAAGCGDDAPAEPDAAIARGTSATFGSDDPGAGPACFLAIDDTSLERLWLLGDAGGQSPPPPLPTDLEPPAVGVFIGTDREGGGPPTVVTSDVEGAAAVIELRLDEGPAESAGGETSPYVIVGVPAGVALARITGDVSLECDVRVPELPRGGEVEDDEVGG